MRTSLQPQKPTRRPGTPNAGHLPAHGGQETKEGVERPRRLCAAAGEGKNGTALHSGRRRCGGLGRLGGCDNWLDANHSGRHWRQLGPEKPVTVWPALAAGKTPSRSQLDLPRQITKPALRDSLGQPSVHGWWLDPQHARHSGRPTKQLDDFSFSHAPIVRYSYLDVNRQSFCFSE